MIALAHATVAALLGAALGVQLFLSYLVAPTAFARLERPAATHLMEGLFPGYYRFGLVTAGLALALALGLALRARSWGRWGVTALLGVMVAGTVYAGGVLLPRAHAARLRAQVARAGDPAPLEFSRLHRQAVAVNVALFAVGLGALGLHAALAAPSPEPGAR